MKKITYQKVGDGFIMLNYHADGADIRLHPRQAEHFLRFGAVRIKPAPAVTATKDNRNGRDDVKWRSGRI